MNIAGVIEDDDQADMRETAELTFDRTCQIMRDRTPAGDGKGGTKRTRTAAGSPTPCRIGLVTPAMQALLDETRVRSRSVRTVTLPAGTAVLSTDQLVIDGVTYDAVEIAGGGSVQSALRVVVAVP